MSSYKTAQRRLQHRGREFHFVSYEGQTADPRREKEATPATWFLMHAGKRWAVAPQDTDLGADELDEFLAVWLDENVFIGPTAGTAAAAPRTRGRRAAKGA